jgi:hypothetical protein
VAVGADFILEEAAIALRTVLTDTETQELNMSRLWLTNVEPGTSDDEIRDFLVKYGFPPFDEIAYEPGDGSRPSVLLTFADIDPTALFQLQQRIHNMFWKKRKLEARVLQDRFA